VPSFIIKLDVFHVYGHITVTEFVCESLLMNRRVNSSNCLCIDRSCC